MSDPLSRRTARAFVRTPFRGEIRLQYGRDEELATETTDVSAGGIFVNAKRPQPVGTLVRFAMPVLGGTRTVTGYGEVSWIRVRDDPKAGPAGMGIQFRYLDDPGETWLREHEAEVQAQAALHPPPAAPAAPASAGDRALPLVRPRPPAKPPPVADPSLWPPEQEDPFPEPPELEYPPLDPLVTEPEQPSRGLGRVGRPVLLAGAGVLLVAAVLLARGPITRWVRGAPATSKPTPTESSGSTEPKAAAPAPLPSTPAPGATAASGPLTRVAAITYGSVPGETIVVLAGDGQILEERVTRQRLGGAEPRELLRIAGIVAPYEPAVIPVGTGELVRIRTGHHPGAGGGELYVVFDLPGPRAGVHRLDFQPTGLRVYLRQRVN